MQLGHNVEVDRALDEPSQCVDGEHEQLWGQRVALADAAFAPEVLSRNAIKEDRRFTRGGDAFKPGNPFVIESHTLHNLYYR